MKSHKQDTGQHPEQSMEERILEAAASLFIAQGFAKTTTGQVAECAGCNQALVHYYYRTKERLFERVFEAKKETLIANLLSTVDMEAGWEEQVAQLVGAHFDFLRANQGLVPFVFREVLTAPERVNALIEKLRQSASVAFDRLGEALEAGIREGVIRPISFPDLIFTIVSLNVAPFLVMAELKTRLGLRDEDVPALLDKRREESIETVLARLRK